MQNPRVEVDPSLIRPIDMHGSGFGILTASICYFDVVTHFAAEAGGHRKLTLERLCELYKRYVCNNRRAYAIIAERMQ